MTTPEVTVSDVPLAPATPVSRPGGRFTQRVSTRVRARVAATARSGKAGGRVLRIVSTVRADGHRWWLVAARPVSLRAWVRTLRPDAARVPEGNALLRRLWTVDNHSTGVVFRVVGTAVYLLAGALVWLGATPIRRWAALLALTALVIWWRVA